MVPPGKSSLAWVLRDLLPYYLVCAHYWLYNFKDICLFLIVGGGCAGVHTHMPTKARSQMSLSHLELPDLGAGNHTLGFL